MKIAIYARQIAVEHFPFLRELFRELQKHGCTLFIYQPLLNRIRGLGDEIPENTPYNSGTEIRGEIDFLFSLGGDGTILDTLTLYRTVKSRYWESTSGGLVF